MLTINPCNLCPRQCLTDRTKYKGYCGCGSEIKVARAALHFWEEPCISGARGSGTVFFSGCNLKCCYCQNHEISAGAHGREVSPARLADIFLKLQAKGAHNINLVTASHYLTAVLKALDIAKPKLCIPVVYNTGGFERLEAIRALEGYADIYLPDLKYYSGELSAKYSGAKEYFAAASQAVKEMIAQTGPPVFDEQGIMKSGVIIRHLVLPGAKDDSIRILRWMSENLQKGSFLLSLMSQYTPVHRAFKFSEINRRVTTYEYEAVVKEAVKLGMDSGFIQQRSSAQEKYTPPFDMEGV